MAIQIGRFYIDTQEQIEKANEWLRQMSSQIISITPIVAGQSGYIKMIVIYDDADPIPEPLVIRRIR